MSTRAESNQENDEVEMVEAGEEEKKEAEDSAQPLHQGEQKEIHQQSEPQQKPTQVYLSHQFHPYPPPHFLPPPAYPQYHFYPHLPPYHFPPTQLLPSYPPPNPLALLNDALDRTGDVQVWVQTHAPDGKAYFYNARTRETSWSRPENAKIMTHFELESLVAHHSQSGETRLKSGSGDDVAVVKSEDDIQDDDIASTTTPATTLTTTSSASSSQEPETATQSITGTTTENMHTSQATTNDEITNNTTTSTTTTDTTTTLPSSQQNLPLCHNHPPPPSFFYPPLQFFPPNQHISIEEYKDIMRHAQDWSEHQNEDGRYYYYHHASMESTWVMPPVYHRFKQAQKNLRKRGIDVASITLNEEVTENITFDTKTTTSTTSIASTNATTTNAHPSTQSTIHLTTLHDNISNNYTESGALSHHHQQQQHPTNITTPSQQQQQQQQNVEVASREAKEPSKPVFTKAVPGTPWCMVWTRDDRHFFYNPSIKQSTWACPGDLIDRQDVRDWMQKGPPVVYPDSSSGVGNSTVSVVDSIIIRNNYKSITADAATASDDDDDDDDDDPPEKMMKSERGPRRFGPYHPPRLLSKPLPHLQASHKNKADVFARINNNNVNNNTTNNNNNGDDGNDDNDREKDGEDHEDGIANDDNDVTGDDNDAVRVGGGDDNDAGRAGGGGGGDDDVVDKVQLSAEERLKKFHELLHEKKVSAFSTWEKELPKLQFDARYHLLPCKERRGAFENYLRGRCGQERSERLAAVKGKKEAFKKFVRECKVTPRSTFHEFCMKHARNAGFKAVEKMKEREALFNEVLTELKQEQREAVDRSSRQAKETFIGMLRATVPSTLLTPGTQWSLVACYTQFDSRRAVLSMHECHFSRWFDEFCAGTRMSESGVVATVDGSTGCGGSGLLRSGMDAGVGSTGGSDGADGVLVGRGGGEGAPAAAAAGSKRADGAEGSDDGEYNEEDMGTESTRREKEKKERVDKSMKHRQKEVEEALWQSMQERDKERQVHLRGEALLVFKALLVDMVKTSDSSWREVRQRLKGDSRWSLCHALEKAEKQKLHEEHLEYLKQKNLNAYHRLLEEVVGDGLDVSWKEVKRKVREEPRAVKYSSSEKKRAKAFEEWLVERRLKARQEFRELLKETKIINHRSGEMASDPEQHLKDIVSILENDKRYLVLSWMGKERLQLLTSYLQEVASKTPPPPPTASEPRIRNPR